MRSCLKFLALVLCSLWVLGSGPALAGDDFDSDAVRKQRHLVELGVFAGGWFPDSDHHLYEMGVSEQRSFDLGSVEIGLRAAYLPFPFVGLEVEGTALCTGIEGGGTADIWTARGHLLAQYPGPLAPFVVVGGGAMGVVSEGDGVGDAVEAAFHWGLGLKYLPTRFMLARLEARQNVGRRFQSGRASFLEVLLGISFLLGWEDLPPPSDTDGDGKPDEDDQCPTEAGTGPDGCPLLDSDGDNVLDPSDRCPHEAGKTPDGCPAPPVDSDGDGVEDAKDACPQQAGEQPGGCPPADSDGDGVIDREDACPQQAGEKPGGCPPADTDSDGIVDASDACPDKPETKNGFKDQDGCPDELPRAVQRFSGAIQGITFETGKATIRKPSFVVLKQAVKVLAEYGDLRLAIRGHTDDVGARQKNLDLSLARAQAVRAYLVSQGIDEARLIAEGLGPDEPAASNKTAGGRAKNRRIEFKLLP